MTKDLSCLLTKVLCTIKDGLVRYCNTKTSRNGVNNMWILKNSTSLLSSLDQFDVHTATSVQTFDFSTLYTSIPHDLLKSRISNLVHNAFRKKDGSIRYTHIKVTRAQEYFTHDINIRSPLSYWDYTNNDLKTRNRGYASCMFYLHILSG